MQISPKQQQIREKPDPQISRIEIERTQNRMTLIIRTAHPGVVIGQDGKSIEGLKKALQKMTSVKNLQINVVEIANPNLDARHGGSLDRERTRKP